ncbi:lysM domain receptor-like kinase 4 [Mangifera indica]|uniref:lysM domain receptor-like kinase 4 n=1 Tax=Mangifera indica TaxID=29780 RepID=UPI001CFB0341|nr:lysM domain receptor-like kinase 4 [Mangifera indica]
MFKMASLTLISVFCLLMLRFRSSIYAQQPYVRKATTACRIVNTSNSNSVLGYSCNGLHRNCKAYLIFRSLPPFNTVASISTLLNSDPSQLSQINGVNESATFATNWRVIVPVNCSCSGKYYQANTTHAIQHDDTYFVIANNTFQGLSTCQALKQQNIILTKNLYSGTRLTVPLRCACPTKNQSHVKVQYLLSYIVTWGDTISRISARYGVDTGRTLEANEISEEAPTIYPFTTVLVPLQNLPTDPQTAEPPPPPPSSPSPPSSKSGSNGGSGKTWIYAVVGVLAGSALTLIFGGVVFFLLIRRSKREPVATVVSDSFEERVMPLNKNSDEESQEVLDVMSHVAQSLKVYDFKELQSATDNFSSSCWIKGSVYRGTINGDFSAIKKMNGDVSKEINLLNKINHSSLVHLSGVCFNEGNWYLVYEFADNGPLSDWIYDNRNEGKVLNWVQRIQIALDVATGLEYLHSFTSPPHVHQDINSGNVLLDSDFRAKIANFSLARPTEGQGGQFALTRHIVGTKGFMAPEYLENGIVSTKLDVYAFGVLMLEILTGKEAAALYGEDNTYLSDALDVVLKDGHENLGHFIDPSMQGNYPSELAMTVIRLIESCLNKSAIHRPAMDEIVHSLSRILNASLTGELSNNISG